MTTNVYTNYQDIVVQPGCDMDFNFQITPFTETCTATMYVDGLVGSPFPVGTTNVNVGVNPVIQFFLTVPGMTAVTGITGTTQGWTAGTYDYRVFVNFQDGSIDELVAGIVLVKTLASFNEG